MTDASDALVTQQRCLPFDPMGALFFPLALVSLIYDRKRRKSKWDILVIVTLLSLSAGMTLSACNLPQGQFTATAIGVPSFPLAAITVTFANGTTVNGLAPALLDGTPSILLTICTPSLPENHGKQYDLTGYLAEAMTKHGRDTRVKSINYILATAEILQPINDIVSKALWLSGYLGFNHLEGSEKEWDIKVGIQRELRGTEAIILCGIGFNCKWLDYSVPGNIHFGYVAYLAKIDHFVAAIAGGFLEQRDLLINGLPLELLYCFQNAFPGHCDNPQDQAAVDFGYMLGEKYGEGITDEQLRIELNTYLWSFQKPPLRFPIPYHAQPQPNIYGADDFNN